MGQTQKIQTVAFYNALRMEFVKILLMTQLFLTVLEMMNLMLTLCVLIKDQILCQDFLYIKKNVCEKDDSYKKMTLIRN